MEYGFKYSLYPTQRQLIEDATRIIRNKEVGIISSPTGTGKTLSLLCTALRFMRTKGDDDDLYALLSTRSKTIIYYCSRTHTQLNQVLNELRSNENAYNAVILGSRRQYCLNTEVNGIQDISRLNQKCREMVADESCRYYKKHHYVGESLDIEDMRKAGEEQVFCPYYYTRSRARECEIVFLPYSLLFTDEGRKSLDINLEDKILIVDEAHNMHDTIVELNSAEVSWADVRRISLAKGLSSDLATIVQRLLAFLRTVSQEGVRDVPDFLLETGLSAFNMFEIEDSIVAERLVQRNDMAVFFEFAKFLKLLTFSDERGRVVFDRTRIRFTPLDPKMYFHEMAKCRSILFAGGTMEPISQLQGVFPGLKYHCYPPVSTNFLSLIISETASKKVINLGYENRNSQIDDVVNTLVMLSNPVEKGGVVFFVPSKSFLLLIRASAKTGNFRRRVCYEGDTTFAEFRKNPQVLFAVMGGRLSEGINFSDDLCRLLVVVGVPYPTKTVEFAERVKHDGEFGVLSAMKTVNQTIGRALRHKDDFAAIVLLDSRYLALRGKLSPWIQRQTKHTGSVEGLLHINRFLKTNCQD